MRICSYFYGQESESKGEKFLGNYVGIKLKKYRRIKTQGRRREVLKIPAKRYEWPEMILKNK